MDVKLVVLRGGKKQQVFALKYEETVLGRKRGCNIRIPSGEVSRRHCRLIYLDGCLIVEDLNSANGTFLNGRALRGAQLVQPGDQLTLGPVTFRVTYWLSPDAETRYHQRANPVVVEEDFPQDAPVVLPPVPNGEDASREALPPPELPRFEDVEDFGLVEEEDEELINPYSRRRAPKKTQPPKEVPPHPDGDSDPPPEIELDESWQLPPDEDIRDLFSDLELDEE
ncbi:MAG: FHA domain-containing protein [Gemmataceae bacterium]